MGGLLVFYHPAIHAAGHRQCVSKEEYSLRAVEGDVILRTLEAT